MLELLTQPDVPEQRLTAVLALATLVSAFGSSFQYGYNVAVINPPEEVTMAKKGRKWRFVSPKQL